MNNIEPKLIGSIVSVKNKSLTNGQEKLMLKIVQSFESKGRIPFEQVVDLYKDFVMRSNNWSYRDQNNEWKTVYRSEEEIERHAQSWIIRAIGSLVTKGYLTILPNIALIKETDLINQKELTNDQNNS